MDFDQGDHVDTSQIEDRRGSSGMRGGPIALGAGGLGAIGTLVLLVINLLGGGSGGVNARTTATVGGANGLVDANVRAGVGTLDANVDATVGGGSLLDANIGIGTGGGLTPGDRSVIREFAQMPESERMQLVKRCRGVTSGGYDAALVPERLPHLTRPPYFCAGLLYAAGDVLAACDVSELLDFAAERGIGVTEQTILAQADHLPGGRTWPEEEIALWEEDRASLGPSFRGCPWAARHYVGAVRHIFWRDALALRAGVRPGTVAAPPEEELPSAS